jgi:hypothetical protein
MLKAISRLPDSPLACLIATCVGAAVTSYDLTLSLTSNNTAGDTQTILLARVLMSLVYKAIVAAYHTPWVQGEHAAFFLRAAAFMIGSLGRVRAPTYMSNMFITLLFALRGFLVEYGFVLVRALLPVIFRWAKKLIMAALKKLLQFLPQRKPASMHPGADHRHVILPPTPSAPRGPHVRAGRGRPGPHESRRQLFMQFLEMVATLPFHKMTSGIEALVQNMKEIMSRYDASTWPGGSNCRTAADKQKGKKDMAKLHNIVRKLSRLTAAVRKP